MTQEQANLPSVPREAPREYTLKGRNTSITYTYISPEIGTGTTPGPHLQPSLNYQGEGGDAKNFTGNELQVQNTIIGMQVTAILSRLPDTPTQVLTLLLPEIGGNLDGQGQSFTALALLTENLATAFIAPKEGALHYHEVIPLQGTVKHFFPPL